MLTLYLPDQPDDISSKQEQVDLNQAPPNIVFLSSFYKGLVTLSHSNLWSEATLGYL